MDYHRGRKRNDSVNNAWKSNTWRIKNEERERKILEEREKRAFFLYGNKDEKRERRKREEEEERKRLKRIEEYERKMKEEREEREREMDRTRPEREKNKKLLKKNIKF